MLSSLLFLILFFTGILSTEVFVCENNNLDISCPPAQVINVNYAFFGRDSTVTCPKSNYDNNTQCSSNNATELAQKNFTGQQNCTLHASIDVFGDPCYGVYKFLQVNYTCVERDVIQVIGCAGNIISLTCPTASVIQIISADYGRHSTTLCPYPLGVASAMQNTNCSLNETSKISQQCNGNQTCDINVDTVETIDPCYGTYKYVTVNYVCSEVPAGVETHVVGCGHAILSITCPTATVIQVTSADYGRHSTTLCPYPQKVESTMKNTNCSLDETAKIAQKCNGNKTCIWSIDTTETVDPCYGTYKYVTVNYVCVPLGVVCGVNEEYGCDNPCFRHCQHKRICSKICTRRCVCKEGYRRDSDTGRCIDEKYCPLPSTNGDSHEVFSECNASCQSTCSNLRSCCTDAPCVAGYICAENYVRNNVTKECVPPTQCTHPA